MKIESYDIEGMSCSSCSSHIEKELNKLKEIQSVNVNLLTNSMTVEYDEKKIDSNIICNTVEKIGYKAFLKKENENLEIHRANTHKILFRTIISILILIPLMYISMGVLMANFPLFGLENQPFILAIFELILSLMVLILYRKFFYSGIKGVIHKSPNMDTLVSLGSGISFLYSFVLTVLIGIHYYQDDSEMAMHLVHNLYFESAAMILIFISIGKLLEEISKGKTTSALKSLMGLSPKTATLFIDNEEKIVRIEEVNVGDIFCVKPGEMIPVDGIVIKGESSVDESSLTGESIPNDKTIGSSVSSGTINQNGYLLCKAEKVGKDTTLQKIIKLMEETNSTKAPIAKLADQVSRVFVPMVLGLSLITFLIWIILSKDIAKSLNYGICVLVISCPCALGLATPVAIMVGSGIGAKKGILFKTAASLENIGKTDIIVLDKTGTITMGNPVVHEVVGFHESEEKIIRISSSLEAKSEHPLAKAICKYAKEHQIKELDITDFKAFSGYGIEGRIDQVLYRIGKKDFIEQTICVSKEDLKILDQYALEGKTMILIANQENLLGAILIYDTMKKDSKKAIQELKNMNKEVVVLTGDNPLAASNIAKSVGLENRVISNVSPMEKEEIVRRFKKYGKVVMVGDGMNDALSLASADVGVSIANGNDIAKDASDVVLMNSDLMSLVESIRLSNRVILNIKENLFWAFIYNIICIPIAAGAFSMLHIELTPMLGALCMSISSLFVVLNALRLNICNISKTRCKKKKMVRIPEEAFIWEEKKNMEKRIMIENMMCEHCSARVKKALEGIEGVEKASVILSEKVAKVVLNKEVEDSILKKVIEDAGYEVVSIDSIEK